MSTKNRQTHVQIGSTQSQVCQDSLKSLSGDLIAEYVTRTERLAPLFSRLNLVRPLPEEMSVEYRLAYERPENLALELSKSILYEDSDSIDIENLKSIKSHGEDSLWNGKPQQYFESINTELEAENASEENDYDADSLTA